MKTKQTTQKLASPLSAVALTLLVVPSVAQAGGPGSSGGGRGSANIGSSHGPGRGGMDNVAGHNINDNRGGISPRRRG